jgi:hypothetical protein
MIISNNLLDIWREKAFFISSPLNITPRISRDKVLFIYETLISFLGRNYFEVAPNSDKPIEKISWIFSLLVNNNHIGCIGALYEFAKLINYAKTLDTSIKKELEDIKESPEQLRTFLFELFIYNILDENKIENKKKTLVNKQIIEGTCIISDTEYLFECRKVFMPKIQELDIMRRLMSDFRKYGNEMHSGFGMICTINFKRPISGKHRSHFESRIKKYFEWFNKFKCLNKIDYFIEDEFGEFKATNYDEATLIETRELKKYDIIFYITPPKVIIPNQPNRYEAKVISNFHVFHSKIYKKLENVLKEKKDQHKNSPFQNKIFFIDSETLPEFHMGLFQNESMFQIDKVKDIYDKLNMKEVICLIRRIYTEENPTVLVDILAREENSSVINKLVKIF